LSKKNSLEKVSRVVAAAAELNELLNQTIDEVETDLGGELCERLKTESMEIGTCIFLLCETIQAEEKNLKSILVFEDTIHNDLKVN
jgi:hypothetical protein